MTPEAVERAARILLDARRQRRQIVELPDDCRPRDLEEAYAVQDRLLGLLNSATAGWFLGCTNPEARRILGMPSPYWARILASALHQSPARLRGADFLTRGIDVEFAFRMADDLPARAKAYTAEDVAERVASLHPAIDIVSAHFADWMHVDWPSLIADNGTDGAIVCGAPVVDWRSRDLARQETRLLVDGHVVEKGSGANVYGNPLLALTWFVNDLSARGRTVRAGELVVTGSCTRIFHVGPVAEVVADFGDMGQVEVTFA